MFWTSLDADDRSILSDMDGSTPIHVIQSSTETSSTGAIPPQELRELSDAALNGALADAIAAVRQTRLELAQRVIDLKQLVAEHDRRAAREAITAPPPAA